MRWNDRQVAMLAEMGIRLWAPETPAASRAPSGGAGDAAVERPAHPMRTRPPASRVPVADAPVAQAPAATAVIERDAERLRAPTTGERSADVGSMDWPELRDAVARCTACKLCSTRRQTVFGVGHPQAHWLIVGEAPGEQEDIQGEPFVGKSGQLLDNMLRALGLSRHHVPLEGGVAGESDPGRQVFIANTLKCRPPGNRNPQPDELARCEPFLIRQIALVRPRVILAMGRFAVQSLLRSDEPVGRLRGRVHRYQGVPLIVTYHPAYLLRNPEDKARAWDDLCLAAETAQALGERA